MHVIEPRSRLLLHSLEAHPRQESQVRQMACDGDGVWVIIVYIFHFKIHWKDSLVIFGVETNHYGLSSMCKQTQ